ncbi:c-type cytochrome [Pigmentiphaga litoralis]|uniref:Mono/diheme cytochrome c family protein n=1 Tax=Pigmentiphaga litoralis TaxID=516702 RepID=A0A7Y9LQB6_9BURK|nr:cytochrome c [Pigmentiphaga litoralis]NYE26336.1 mono/diheme cytochrome c family protein [Pigmentiphaga litoralis]NYE85456.1 mono/diheme cytochrome c family protein [Pigmentiphaga litoralis]
MMRRSYTRLSGSGISLMAALVLMTATMATHAAAPTASADQAMIDRGRYLATASDCIACHTTHHGKPMAGGLVMSSPVGDIVSTNITPSRTHGIGTYTEQQFSNAVRKGVRADGAHLYPAMPYPSYAVMTDDDIHAMYVYFMHGVDAVDKETAPTTLPFPMNLRFLMTGWNLLFVPDAPLVADPDKSEAWNRGRYLTLGAAHCSTCHTPRGFMMQEQLGKSLGGAQVGPWYAPNITPDKATGIGTWSQEDLVTYLRTGRVEGKAQAAGSMAEAISFSFSKLTDDDLNAIATYVRDVPAVRTGAASTSAASASASASAASASAASASPSAPAGKADGAPVATRFDRGTASNDLPDFRGEGYVNGLHGRSPGGQLFSANCASCHGYNAQGTQDGYYPSLFSNSATAGANPSNLIATILYGVDRNTPAGHVFMPPFGSHPNAVTSLNNDEVALLANYVFEHHGDASLKVSAQDVQQIREGGPRSNLVTLARIGMAAGFLVVVLLVMVGMGMRRRRSRSAR